jgi:peroxiredoxin
MIRSAYSKIRLWRVLCRFLGLLGLAGVCAGAHAALKVGDQAPDFTAQAARAGNAFTFSLTQVLAKGPVVLYFYPKSFTSGCTQEAHEFAEATERFAALGATVIGVSHDDIDTQKDFSKRECRDKFAVAADADAQIIRAYDVGMALMPNTASRISFVISPQGKVLFVLDSMHPSRHIDETYRAVQRWHQQQPTTTPH